MVPTNRSRPLRGAPRASIALLAALASMGARVCAGQGGDDIQSLAQLSLGELSNVEVTSVSKNAQPLGHAPAAIYVITHDEIVRSGATTLADALRLAPNLQVTQLTSSSHTVSARGFFGNPSDQSFSNKMLVLIDGRSAYNPLFSGVYLDALDVLLDDVDRIEVVSGPGAALWGSNAVNGVINVITRPADLTQGGLVGVEAGNLERDVRARYGDRIGDDGAVRVYGKAFYRSAMDLPDGSSAHDSWYKAQGGFRYDWTGAADSVMARGDAYRALEREGAPGDRLVTGADMLARWRHRSDRSDLQLQAYYDMSERAEPAGGGAFVLHTYDVELQQRLSIGARDEVVWGAGERIYQYAITNTSLAFVPDRRALTLGNVFAQNTLMLGPVDLMAALKAEDDPYVGWQLQPDARIAWNVSGDTLLWAAASRAVRAPTPFEEDVLEKIGTLTALTGNRGFRPERLTAFQAGFRGRPMGSLSLSVSAFYNEYDRLRSIEPSPATGLFPLEWANRIGGHTLGIEAWADWQVTSWWRLSPGFTALHESLRFEPGASAFAGIAQETDDPSSHASLESSMNLRRDLTLDAELRYVGALPSPALPAYTELGTRIAWHPVRGLELSLTGRNLLHARHLEFPAPDGEAIDRGVLAGVEWRF